MENNKDLEQRTFTFAVDVVRLLQDIKYSTVNDVIKYQLAKASTSVGANYEEAQGSFSKDDFKFKINIREYFEEIKRRIVGIYFLRFTFYFPLFPFYLDHIRNKQ